MGRFTAVTLIIVLNCIIYINTLDATWHFDDIPNIVKNKDIHIESLTPQTLYEALFLTNEQGKKKLSRPLSRLSLALNWYFGRGNVTGYHMVNLIIHCLAAVFLYSFLLHLLSLPRIGFENKSKIHFIALLSAVLWSINPLQTQAVTYIVQRMASMAGMFYILAMLCYLKARCYCPERGKKVIWFFGAGFSFILGFFSKENALVLPFSILLLEMVFIQDLENPVVRKRLFIISGIVVSVMVIISVPLVLKGDPLSFLNGYERRPFSLAERLLTQPRIVLFYISLLFYPVPTRLNLDHDVIVSTSLFSPITTFPAIIALFGLVLFGLWKFKIYPLLSFAVLFFFLNHAVESSFIPLELIFEHRNYIPSMFIFVPVSMLLYKALDYYKSQKIMKGIFILFGIFLMISLGFSTYNRNLVWYSEKKLWEDCISKNPNSIRSYHNLAYGHYGQLKEYDKAIALFKKASTLKNNANYSAVAETYSSIALLYWEKKDIDLAKSYWLKAIDLFNLDSAFYGLSLVSIEKKEVDSALYYIDKAIESCESNASFFKANSAQSYYLTKGMTLLHNSPPQKAIPIFRKLLKKGGSPNAVAGLGTALTISGFHDRGLWFLKRAKDAGYSGRKLDLYFADAYYRKGNLKLAQKYLRNLIEATSHKNMIDLIEKLNVDITIMPVHNDLKDMLKKELMILYRNLPG